MSQFIDDKHRRMVPRWRDSKEANRLGETAPLRLVRSVSETGDQAQASFAKIQQAWKDHKGIAYANDLVAASVVQRKTEEAKEAAEFILTNAERTTEGAIHLAHKVLRAEKSDAQLALPFSIRDKAILQTRQLRRILRNTPDNPVGWVDLARQYIILGEHEKAGRAMRIAIGMAPQHRFILRAATRLFHFFGKSDEALHLLRGKESTKNDPWLIAAEIAMARIVDRQPKYVRRGKDILESAKFSPFHTSELASSLASLDFEHGVDRQARKKFELALRSPTENSVAQVSWAKRHRLAIDLSCDYLQGNDVFEAQAWDYLTQQAWSDALAAAGAWLIDEPFSSRPAMFGGHIALVVLEDYHTAEHLLKIGINANPRDFGLLNNLAFCRAAMGDLEGALKYFSLIETASLTLEDRITYVATAGLISYRAGDHESGRRLYSAALDRARESGDPQLELSALCFFAREEIQVHGPRLEELKKHFFKLESANRELTLLPLIERLKLSFKSL